MHGVLYFLDLKDLHRGFSDRLQEVIAEYHLSLDQASELFKWFLERAMWRVLQDIYNCRLTSYFPNQTYEVIYDESKLGHQFEIYLYDLLKSRNLPFRPELKLDSMLSSDSIFYMTF